MNAGMQCLLSMPKFVECMAKEFHSGNLEDKESLKSRGQAYHVHFENEGRSGKTCTPVGICGKNIPSNKQHDMPEFFRFLVEQIENELGEENSIATVYSMGNSAAM